MLRPVLMLPFACLTLLCALLFCFFWNYVVAHRFPQYSQAGEAESYCTLGLEEHSRFPRASKTTGEGEGEEQKRKAHTVMFC